MVSGYDFKFYKGKLIDPFEINMTDDWVNSGGSISESLDEFRVGSKSILASAVTTLTRDYSSSPMDLSEFDYVCFWIMPVSGTAISFNIENSDSWETKVTESNLSTGQWNFVQLDISSMTRDDVTAIRFEDTSSGKYYIDHLGVYDSTDYIEIKGTKNQMVEQVVYSISQQTGVDRYGAQTVAYGSSLRSYSLTGIISEDITNESIDVTLYNWRKFFHSRKKNSDGILVKGNLYLLVSDILKSFIRVQKMQLNILPPKKIDYQIMFLECLDYV